MKKRPINMSNRSELRALRDAIRTALGKLEPIVTADGTTLAVELSVGSCRYSPGTATFKLIAARVGEDGVAPTPERIAFRDLAHAYGLKPEDLDRQFQHNRKTYSIIGLKPRPPKFPILARSVIDGRIYKFPEVVVSEALGYTTTTPVEATDLLGEGRR